MSLLAEGDMAPLGELYARYGGAVRSLLWRLLPNESVADVEDLCHEVFEILYKTADRFRQDCALRPWIFGIAARRARSSQRKLWLRNRLLKRYVHEQKVTMEHIVDSPDEKDVTLHQIGQVMAMLPHAQREVLVLAVNHNLSGEQIAETLGININTVWTRLRRARMTVRDALNDLNGEKDGGKEK